jgi:hypothetical protein
MNLTAGANNFVRYFQRRRGGRWPQPDQRPQLAGLQSENPPGETSPLDVSSPIFFDLLSWPRPCSSPTRCWPVPQRHGPTGVLGQKYVVSTADATVTGLAFQKALIGDIAVKATNPTANRYDIDARLTGGKSGSIGGYRRA